ncbi:acid protease [Westerdykella ornata]|uniref:Acid protease n=1 Tax=Westerdykella ornata TaxID=318751 RepID=A0A6A6JIK7_WESOR|nr:acid protease [Westerdykella ornata]KAF2276401.1 acid protease [Westerdykella ornata]
MPKSLKEWCGFGMLVPQALAITFRTPVSDHIVSKLLNAHRYDVIQSHLYRVVPSSDLHSKQSSLQDVALVAYGVNITVGTPQQTVKVLLDNNFPFLFIQSADCDSSLCSSYGHSGFNSSGSSSYQDGGSGLQKFHYANVDFEGIKAKDLVGVAGLELDEQVFENVVTAKPRTFFHWYFDYNGVLGLGRLPSEYGLHSPWQSIMDRRLLTNNVISFVFPQGVRDMDSPRNNGEVSIGGYPPNFTISDYIRLPLLTREASRPGSGFSWATSLQTLTYQNQSSTLYHETFGRSAAAYFSTALPYIQLPRRWVRLIMSSVGPTEHNGFFESFPCEKRNTLPSLVFGLGNKNITLSATEYTFELKSTKRKTHNCVIALDSSDSGFSDDAENAIIGLGWPFLENFEVIFNEDELAVLLKQRVV